MPWGNFTGLSQSKGPKYRNPRQRCGKTEIDVENPEFSEEMIHKCGEK